MASPPRQEAIPVVEPTAISAEQRAWLMEWLAVMRDQWEFPHFMRDQGPDFWKYFEWVAAIPECFSVVLRSPKGSERERLAIEALIAEGEREGWCWVS